MSGNRVERLGGAVYPTVSLSNHSCAPNSTRNYEGSTCIVRSKSTIRKGDEITDNYGFFYQIHPEEERRETLSKQYKFDCDCTACKLHWPMLDQIRGKTSVWICAGCRTPLKMDAKVKKCPKCKKELKMGKLIRGIGSLSNDVKMALESLSQNPPVVDSNLSRFLDYLKLIEPNVQHPSADFMTCQQIFALCLSLKANCSLENESNQNY